jgi:hypothetical protein
LVQHLLVIPSQKSFAVYRTITIYFDIFDTHSYVIVHDHLPRHLGNNQDNTVSLRTAWLYISLAQSAAFTGLIASKSLEKTRNDSDTIRGCLSLRDIKRTGVMPSREF